MQAQQSDDFIQVMAWLAPNGDLAARNALAAGMRPEELVSVVAGYPPNKSLDWPALTFHPAGGGSHVFRPSGNCAPTPAKRDCLA